MFKAIANWFKGLFGKAEQQVVKDKQIVDSFEQWSKVVNEIPTAKVEEVAKPYPVIAEETVKSTPTKAAKKSPKKASTQPAKETTKATAKTSAKKSKTSAKSAQKSAESPAPTPSAKRNGRSNG
jgi:hypothetical protein